MKTGTSWVPVSLYSIGELRRVFIFRAHRTAFIALPVSLIHRFAGGILHVPPGILSFPLHLVRCALGLQVAVPGPFADLTLDPSFYIGGFPFNTIFIHCKHSLVKVSQLRFDLAYRVAGAPLVIS